MSLTFRSTQLYMSNNLAKQERPIALTPGEPPVTYAELCMAARLAAQRQLAEHWESLRGAEAIIGHRRDGSGLWRAAAPVTYAELCAAAPRAAQWQLVEHSEGLRGAEASSAHPLAAAAPFVVLFGHAGQAPAHPTPATLAQALTTPTQGPHRVCRQVARGAPVEAAAAVPGGTGGMEAAMRQAELALAALEAAEAEDAESLRSVEASSGHRQDGSGLRWAAAPVTYAELRGAARRAAQRQLVEHSEGLRGAACSGPRQADWFKDERKRKQNKISQHSPGQLQDQARSMELGRLLEERLSQSAIVEEESACINEALHWLDVTLKQAGERWCARPFGSLCSTFSTRDSDVDVTCLCQDGLPADQNLASLISEKIGPLFRSHPRFAVVKEVLHAKEPLLKLRFDDRLDIDLTCQNTKALQNTRLLRGYADLDERVRSLVIAVKLWAKGAGVCGAPDGKLSSYAFTLLAIYYLQVHPEVKLPCLPSNGFPEEAYLRRDVQRIVIDSCGPWPCLLSTVELLRRFFQFYHSAFQWGEEVVSVRLGKRRTRAGPEFAEMRGRHVQRLHIEDPLLRKRNLHCVLSVAEEARLRRAFAQAAHQFSIGSLPVGLAGTAAVSRSADRGSAPEATVFDPSGAPLVTAAPGLISGLISGLRHAHQRQRQAQQRAAAPDGSDARFQMSAAAATFAMPGAQAARAEHLPGGPAGAGLQPTARTSEVAPGSGGEEPAALDPPFVPLVQAAPSARGGPVGAGFQPTSRTSESACGSGGEGPAALDPSFVHSVWAAPGVAATGALLPAARGALGAVTPAVPAAAVGLGGGPATLATADQPPAALEGLPDVTSVVVARRTSEGTARVCSARARRQHLRGMHKKPVL